MKKLNVNVIIGVFLLLTGVLMTLNVLGFNLHINYSVILWVFITLIGLIIMINDNKINILSLVITFVGLWNLLNAMNIVTASIFSLIWPIIIIIIGLNLVFTKSIINRVNVKCKSDGNTYNGVFGGVSQKITVKDFKGLTANAVFGGVELDLRDIEISENIELNLNAIFGGIDIILSDKYNVLMVESLGIFGGTDNKYSGINDENKKNIYINSRAIFGGIDIK